MKKQQNNGNSRTPESSTQNPSSNTPPPSCPNPQKARKGAKGYDLPNANTAPVEDSESIWDQIGQPAPDLLSPNHPSLSDTDRNIINMRARFRPLKAKHYM